MLAKREIFSTGQDFSSLALVEMTVLALVEMTFRLTVKDLREPLNNPGEPWNASRCFPHLSRYSSAVNGYEDTNAIAFETAVRPIAIQT